MTIDKKSAALVVLLVALAAGAVFWWQNMNRPAPESQEVPTVQDDSAAVPEVVTNLPAPTPAPNTDVSVAPLSLGAAMLAVPKPELAVWGTALGPEGLFFVWTTTAPPKTDASTYVGYTVDLKAGTVIESVRRDGLGRVRFARTGEPKGLFALEWEECWEGCNRKNDYFDLTNGKLLYTTSWSPTVGGSASLIVDNREIGITWDPKDGCSGDEDDVGKIVTVKGFIVDGRSVPFDATSTVRCESGYGGSTYPPFSSFVIEKAQVGLRALLQDGGYVFALSIPLDPLDLSKATAGTR